MGGIWTGTQRCLGEGTGSWCGPRIPPQLALRRMLTTSPTRKPEYSHYLEGKGAVQDRLQLTLDDIERLGVQELQKMSSLIKTLSGSIGWV